MLNNTRSNPFRRWGSILSELKVLATKKNAWSPWKVCHDTVWVSLFALPRRRINFLSEKTSRARYFSYPVSSGPHWCQITEGYTFYRMECITWPFIAYLTLRWTLLGMHDSVRWSLKMLAQKVDWKDIFLILRFPRWMAPALPPRTMSIVPRGTWSPKIFPGFPGVTLRSWYRREPLCESTEKGPFEYGHPPGNEDSKERSYLWIKRTKTQKGEPIALWRLFEQKRAAAPLLS